jgi:hypothetical protein
MGSDHQVYTDSSFSIPAVYLNDWPDRYIHTHRDVPENIDASKLERAAFIGAATALVLANATTADGDALRSAVVARSTRRTARVLERMHGLPDSEAATLGRFHLWHEETLARSLSRFLEPTELLGLHMRNDQLTTAILLGGLAPAVPPAGEGAQVYRRRPEPKGPLSAFGYDYFTDKLGAEKVRAVRLLQHEGARGGGDAYAYEALNLLDGRRTLQEVRDMLSAIYGPVPLELVAEYVRALESIGVVSRVTSGNE